MTTSEWRHTCTGLCYYCVRVMHIKIQYQACYRYLSMHCAAAAGLMAVMVVVVVVYTVAKRNKMQLLCCCPSNGQLPVAVAINHRRQHHQQRLLCYGLSRYNSHKAFIVLYVMEAV